MTIQMVHGVAVWSRAEWLEDAITWLDERLYAAGISRTGDVEQTRVRPWSTVVKAPTSHGLVWLKAVGPGTAFEVPLYGLLQRVTPERVLTPIAIDAARSMVLLPDGGEILGQREDAKLAEALNVVLPQYAELQRKLAGHRADLLDAGVVDMRPSMLPERFREALAAARGWVESAGSDADKSTLGRLDRLEPELAAWCAELEQAPGAATIDHNDLHPWNVFVSGEGPALSSRFYDWGDAVIAHPFASMLVGLGWMKLHRKLADTDPRILRARDAYLEPFADLASRTELVRVLELAAHVGKVARALIWHRAVSSFGAEGAGEFAGAPFKTLAGLLDSSYLSDDPA